MGDDRAQADGFAVDLTNCDREPIHVLGSVQSFGFLIALTADWLVSRASANIESFIGRTPETLSLIHISEPTRH